MDERNNTERSLLICFRETESYSFKQSKCSFFGTRLVESTFHVVKDNLDFAVASLSPNEKFISLL